MPPGCACCGWRLRSGPSCVGRRSAPLRVTATGISPGLRHAVTAQHGCDVGIPIITFKPSPGVSFFAPVISLVPDDAEVPPLWNAVVTVTSYPGFAEMKRSLREAPQLTILGGSPKQEDRTGGHRVGHLARDRDTATVVP